MKALIDNETILAYPYFSKRFTIHTDVSDVQLGVVIMQDVKPPAFYSRKLSKTQINYTMAEKDILSIVETCKEFWNIILGHKIEVFTDHNNLTYETIESASHSIQISKSLIKYFEVTLLYIKGDANVVSYAFIQLLIAHHAHKLADITLEEDTCELLCLDSLFISNNKNCSPSI